MINAAPHSAVASAFPSKSSRIVAHVMARRLPLVPWGRRRRLSGRRRLWRDQSVGGYDRPGERRIHRRENATISAFDKNLCISNWRRDSRSPNVITGDPVRGDPSPVPPTALEILPPANATRFDQLFEIFIEAGAIIAEWVAEPHSLRFNFILCRHRNRQHLWAAAKLWLRHLEREECRFPQLPAPRTE